MKGPLSGIRIADLTWLLAGPGGTRIAAAMGAEVIRCEWINRIDFLRLGPPQVPLPGQEIVRGPVGSQDALQVPINRNGNYNEINAGKLSVSLNLEHESGRELFKRLVAVSDVVVDNFSANVMGKLGLEYDALKAVKSDIIYVQASGWGNVGDYRGYRAVGPTAQAISGLTAQSGLPGREPAGWGFSVLDHHGGYFVGLAIVMALLHRRRTGQGVYVDAAQVSNGLIIGGTGILNHSANGSRSVRTGNRSPNRPAAPHGAYPCLGIDRWIAISCFNEPAWEGLVAAMGSPEWAHDLRFATLEDRVANQDDLDEMVARWTRDQESYGLMALLQARGVPAGVCQTAQQKVEVDPQLAATNYLVELPHTEIGSWPVQSIPFSMSATPTLSGAPTQRGAPCYGEDNDYVYKQLLGITAEELADLRATNAI